MKRKPIRDKKYFAPQDGGEYHKCDAPGCTERGEFRAPKDKSLKEYYWFCLKHVQEYNSRWNYYAGGEDAEEQERIRKHFSGFSSRIRYSFGFDFDKEFQAGGYDFKHFEYSDAFFTRQEREYLKIMELSTSEALDASAIKKQYKKLVKMYHPDLYQNDHEKEEKIKQINNAYNELMKRFE